MKNIWLIIKSNLFRLKGDKFTLIMIGGVLPILVCLGIYFSSNTEIKGKIAIINPTKAEETAVKSFLEENTKIKLEVLNENITNTSIIKGEYLAEISFEGEKLIVNEYSNKEIKGILESVFNGEVYENTIEEIGVVQRIVGFLIMFLAYGAIGIANFFLQDRETGVYMRVLTGNINYFQYILGQIIYIVSVLTIPTIAISLAVVKVLNVNLNMSYLKFSGILFLVGVLCSSMIILISNIFNKKDEVQMNASIIIMITCLFSGCLVSIDGSNKIVEAIRNIFPQKRLLDFIQNSNSKDFIFVIGSILLFIIIGVYIGNKKYKRGMYL